MENEDLMFSAAEAVHSQAQESAQTVTVAELDNLIKEIAEFTKLKDELEEKLTEINKEISSREVRGAKFLEELKREDYTSPYGSLVKEEKWTVTIPKTVADKQAFFGWMEKQGIFWDYVTINSNSLKGLYNREMAQAKERGDFLFEVPGLQPPNLFVRSGFKPPKKPRG